VTAAGNKVADVVAGHFKAGVRKEETGRPLGVSGPASNFLAFGLKSPFLNMIGYEERKTAMDVRQTGCLDLELQSALRIT
jgi:hypothetical protein